LHVCAPCVYLTVSYFTAGRKQKDIRQEEETAAAEEAAGSDRDDCRRRRLSREDAGDCGKKQRCVIGKGSGGSSSSAFAGQCLALTCYSMCIRMSSTFDVLYHF
jgi:hypothetical protein